MKHILIMCLSLITTVQAYSQIQTINVGTSANDRTGDPIRTAFQKVNANFDYLDELVDDNAVRIDSLVDASGGSYVPTSRTINGYPLSSNVIIGPADIVQTSSFRFVSDAEKATWNAKQSAISLTTTGTSGASTFSSNTLNVPRYDTYADSKVDDGTIEDGVTTRAASEDDVFDALTLKAERTREYGIYCSDLTTTLTSGTSKVYFRIPRAFTVTAVRASVLTAQSSGSILTIDINDSGTTILSTKLTIDNNEKTSTTAATAAVISDTSIADDAEVTVDIDQVGSSPVGLMVWLIGY